MNVPKSIHCHGDRVAQGKAIRVTIRIERPPGPAVVAPVASAGVAQIGKVAAAVSLVVSEAMPFVDGVKHNGIAHMLYLTLKGAGQQQQQKKGRRCAN